MKRWAKTYLAFDATSLSTFRDTFKLFPNCLSFEFLIKLMTMLFFILAVFVYLDFPHLHSEILFPPNNFLAAASKRPIKIKQEIKSCNCAQKLS